MASLGAPLRINPAAGLCHISWAIIAGTVVFLQPPSSTIENAVQVNTLSCPEICESLLPY